MRGKAKHLRNNLIGKRFGRLVVLFRDDNNQHNHICWLCQCDCGKIVRVVGQTLKSGDSKSCGCLRSDIRRAMNGPRSPNWKGGKYKNKDGYVLVWCDTGDYRFEHRMVMEHRLGRKLLPTEEAHHKNGIRSDNRDDNLELWVKGHSPGQRAKDILEWAEQFIRTYRPIKPLLE